jgi:hypothetical protein
MSNNKKNTIAGQWDEYIAPFLQSLRVPQKGEPGYKPVTTTAQDIEQIEKAKKQSMLDSMQSQQLPAMESQPVQEMNPIVKEYIAKKIQSSKVPATESLNSQNEEIQAPLVKKPGYMDKFNDEAYANAKQDSESRQDGLGWLQFAAGFGDALAQRSPMESANKFENIRARIKDETVGQFNRDKSQAVDDFKNNKMMDTFNPDSEQSIAFKKMIEAKFPDVARSYGKMWNQVSAADKDNIFEPLKLKENIEARKDSMRIAAMGRQDALNAKLADKNDKKKMAMNEIEDRRQNINSNIAQLKSMIEEDGTWEATGSHNQDIDRLTEQIATDMAKLMDPSSVARPAEVEQIKKTLVKPGFSNKNSTAIDILSNFETEVNRRADNAYTIRGLDSPQGRPKAMENGVQPVNNIDSKVSNFMKKNGITDKNEAIRILKENGKI